MNLYTAFVDRIDKEGLYTVNKKSISSVVSVGNVQIKAYRAISYLGSQLFSVNLAGANYIFNAFISH